MLTIATSCYARTPRARRLSHPPGHGPHDEWGAPRFRLEYELATNVGMLALCGLLAIASTLMDRELGIGR